MRQTGEDEPRPSLEQTAVAATVAQRLRYRAAYEELSLIHRDLVSEVSRFAELIEARLTPRRIE